MKLMITGQSGYIGSRLVPFLKEKDYEIVENVEDTDVAILLGGISSVSRAKRLGYFKCIEANVQSLTSLLGMFPMKTLFASSASIYNQLQEPNNPKLFGEMSEPQNAYDFSKFMMDASAKQKNMGTAMRFSTVCGGSPNQRRDLILNSFYFDYKTKGFITVSNPTAMRSVVGFKELCTGIEKLIQDPSLEYQVADFCTHSGSISDFATAFSKYFGCQIRYEIGGETTYSFSVRPSKFSDETLYDIFRDLEMNFNFETAARRD